MQALQPSKDAELAKPCINSNFASCQLIKLLGSQKILTLTAIDSIESTLYRCATIYVGYHFPASRSPTIQLVVSLQCFLLLFMLFYLSLFFSHALEDKFMGDG
jgi:hypothetical protein